MIGIGIGIGIPFAKGNTGKSKQLPYTDDAARYWLGGDWRMPTYDEFSELNKNCAYECTGNYAKFTSKINSNSIIFPLGGYKSGNNISSEGNYFYVRTASKDDENFYYFYGTSSTHRSGNTRSAFTGMNIRAVSPTQGVDLGLSVKWNSMNIGAENPESTGFYFSCGDIEPDNNTSTLYPFYIDGQYRKYNEIDGLTTIELESTTPKIQNTMLWRFVKDRFDETTKELNTSDVVMTEQEVRDLISNLWSVSEARLLEMSGENGLYIVENVELLTALDDKGWSLSF